jgi:putative heme-binding domain-containing protein
MPEHARPTVGLLLAGVALLIPCFSFTQEHSTGLAWIWTEDGDLGSAPSGDRFFRKTFQLKAAPKQGALEITADNSFTVWVNGVEVGSNDKWEEMSRFDVTSRLAAGRNVIAVKAHNDSGPAGLLVKLTATVADGGKIELVSDGTWKAAKEPGEGWQKPGFDDGKWGAAKVLAKYGEGPWGRVDADGRPKGGFVVPAGFRVEAVVPPLTKAPGLDDPGRRFSLINICFDARGRLFASQEGGPILLCTEPDRQGVFQKVAPYCTLVRNSQGMCWVHDALYLVGDGPKGTGLYRCEPATDEDRIAKAEQILKFRGGMGEHGPHAVLHGPDDRLYVVIGNHGWAQPEKLAANSPLTRWPNGSMGPDQGKPGTTEDVLLPRQNDANGHAANILAPGGTIWRLDADGKNPALVAAGFRNHFDAAFSPDGELFTFDSDMEWDEGLPWYRPVRVCHCPPGADFLWRTGAANTPDYYIDSLPPVLATGRGSPTGLEFYDHSAFPPKYRGALFMCDWSIGVIWAVHLQRDGATYTGKAEKFCIGKPMPVTDCAVGPDGALYFTLGGRNTQGGIYRIVAELPGTSPERGGQPLAPWSHTKTIKAIPANLDYWMLASQDADPVMRARAVENLGILGEIKAIAAKDLERALLAALKDSDPLVRRRACEAFIRAGIEPPVALLRPLLADKDRFLRTAARLVLQRIDPAKWADALLRDGNDQVAREAVIALCKTDRAAPLATSIFERLHESTSSDDVSQVLEWLRTVQMALIHTRERPGAVRGIAVDCKDFFPHKDWRVNRELAILLAEFARIGELEPQEVIAPLLAALESTKDDRAQQIHYFYCLRLVHDGWTAEQKRELLAWFEGTRTWTGGASFTGFLQNILRDLSPIFTADDRAAVFAKLSEMPATALALVRADPTTQLPPARLKVLYSAAASMPNLPRAADIKTAIIDALKQTRSDEARNVLRQIARTDAAQRGAALQALLPWLSNDDFPLVMEALKNGQFPRQSTAELFVAMQKNGIRPKADDGNAFRAILLTSRKLDENQRWKAVELLQAWTGGRQFGAEKGDWKKELAAWGRWFAQTFPNERPLPDLAAEPSAESKYKFADLLTYLEKDPRGRRGDAAKGKAVFTKAQCIKCHKYGAEGEGIGPDLTNLSQRFKRSEVLESIVYPSKVISDQYRSTRIVTLDGQSYNGLAAPMGDTVTVLLQDGSKVTLKKSDIERQFASLISVMPERLLDELTLEEIADLFAYFESPAKKE